MKTPVLLLTAAGALTAAACAPTGSIEQASGAANGARPCFYADRVLAFQRGPTGSVFVRSDRNQVFELTAAGTCRDLNNVNVLGLETLGGPNTLCAGDWAVAHLPGSSSIQAPCRVQVSRALTAAEVEALEPRYRP